MKNLSQLQKLLWESPGCPGFHRLAPRSTLFPFSDDKTARKINKEFSPWILSLAGKWKFRYISNPENPPQNFCSPELKDESWNNIAVQGCWQMQGYDHPHYTNSAMSWLNSPPSVPS
ncbi:MAG: hypothetical protein WCI51_08030 [Lentisphaerota bacterium]